MFSHCFYLHILGTCLQFGLCFQNILAVKFILKTFCKLLQLCRYLKLLFLLCLKSCLLNVLIKYKFYVNRCFFSFLCTCILQVSGHSILQIIVWSYQYFVVISVPHIFLIDTLTCDFFKDNFNLSVLKCVFHIRIDLFGKF